MVFPVVNQFSSFFLRLDQSISLDISSDAEVDMNLVRSQLQMLTNQAPSLYFLTISH